MKGLLTLITSILIIPSLFSQIDHINCIIFIDGKLPESGIIDECISFTDNLNIVRNIECNYIIGDLQLSKTENDLLKSLNQQDFIQISFKYKHIDGLINHYEGKLCIEWLYYRYLIIRITTLSKKRGTYYFAYSTPGISKAFIKNEYNMFEDYK